MPKPKKTKSNFPKFDLLEYLQLYHNSKFNLYVKPSNLTEAGLGVFTHDFIPANTFVDFYEGFLSEYFKGGNYFFQINDKWGIDGFGPPRCYMAMLNDANYKVITKTKKKSENQAYQTIYSNNCQFVNDEVNLKVSIYTIVDIEPESELFISYGNNYWNN
jgi:hypothetical protein